MVILIKIAPSTSITPLADRDFDQITRWPNTMEQNGEDYQSS